MRSSRRFDLTVQYACDRQVAPTRAELRRWARAALPGAAQVTIRLVDEEEGRALNRRYRGKDDATNVLSFAYGMTPVVHGDLVLCLPVALREAASQHKAPAAHLAHLVVHGMLHLQGFDHENDDDALRMEGREREILAALGLADPYANS